jgi:hypothetical protein
MKNTLIARIASTLDAWKRCAAPNAPAHLEDWKHRHAARLDAMAKELPSGAGIDCGTKIDRDRSTPEKIILTMSYHHMNENGYYDGWTEHTITCRPSFIHGIKLTIGGRDRNQVKDYLHDVYSTALSEPYEHKD